MTQSKTKGYVWAAVVLTAVVSGCATARMAPPADVASGSEVLAVSDRSSASGLMVNEGFKIGSFDVTDVNRDWDSKSAVGVGPWSKESKTTGYTYALASGDKKLTGKCASETSSQGIATLTGSVNWESLKVACACEGEGAMFIVP